MGLVSPGAACLPGRQHGLRPRRQRQQDDSWAEDWEEGEGEAACEEAGAWEEGSEEGLSPSPPPKKKQRGQAR